MPKGVGFVVFEEPMAEKSDPSLVKLAADIADVQRQLTRMQQVGGFADSKTLSKRATRLEGRTEKLELQVETLLSVAGSLVTMMSDHLRDRHDSDLERDSAIDTTTWRSIRKALFDLTKKLRMQPASRPAS
jgi:hypothetical protein